MTSQALNRVGRANLVTGLRAALIVALLLGPLRDWPLILGGLVALALDGVDGWVARRYGEASAFGARFDMEVDAAFMLGLSALVAIEGRAGFWVLIAGLLRYAWIAAAAFLPWLRRPLGPSRARQTGCILALLLLLAALSPPASGRAGSLMAAGAVASLLLSFGRDLIRLWRVRAMDLSTESHYLSVHYSTTEAQERP